MCSGTDPRCFPSSWTADTSARGFRIRWCSSRDVATPFAKSRGSSQCAVTCVPNPAVAARISPAIWKDGITGAFAVSARYILKAVASRNGSTSFAEAGAAYRPKSTFADRETSRNLLRSASRVETGGFVFGMSTTVVTPPAAALSVPEEKSSFSVIPGSRKCTWTSTPPGRIRASEYRYTGRPRSLFLIATILPSSIPIEVGRISPPTKARPSRTSIPPPQLAPHGDPPGLHLREDFGLERVHPGRVVEPRIGEEAR